MAITKIIGTGRASTDDKALEWLKAHGATLVHSLAPVDLIELPENARLERGNQYWQWTITFPDEDPYVEVELYADLCETVLKFHPEGAL